MAILYSLHFIIVFNLILQQRFLWLNWTKLEIFVNNCAVSLFHLHLKMCNSNSLCRRTFNHLHLLLSYYIFWRKFYKIESIILLYFEVFKKNNKSHFILLLHYFFSFLTKWTSVVRMFRYHVIKINEVKKIDWHIHIITIWDFEALKLFQTPAKY